MTKGNLFSHVIKKEEEIEVPLPDSTFNSTIEDKSKGFLFKPGNLLPKRERKWRFPIKNIIFIVLFVFLFIFVMALMSANSNLVENTKQEVFLLDSQLNICNTDKTTHENLASGFKIQLDTCNSRINPMQQTKCSVSDCIANTYSNATQSIYNSTYIQSLKKEIRYLENLTYECLNVNSTFNSTSHSLLNECRAELKQIKDILED